MSKTLADFTINDPNNMNLKNVIAFNDSDYYYRQFNKDIPEKTCSNLYNTWNIKTLEKTNETVDTISNDISRFDNVDDPTKTTCNLDKNYGKWQIQDDTTNNPQTIFAKCIVEKRCLPDICMSGSKLQVYNNSKFEKQDNIVITFDNLDISYSSIKQTGASVYIEGANNNDINGKYTPDTTNPDTKYKNSKNNNYYLQYNPTAGYNKKELQWEVVNNNKTHVYYPVNEKCLPDKCTENKWRTVENKPDLHMSLYVELIGNKSVTISGVAGSNSGKINGVYVPMLTADKKQYILSNQVVKYIKKDDKDVVYLLYIPIVTANDATNIDSCYKKSLCYNAALHSQIKYLTGIKASEAKDVNYMDINKQYNFNVITTVNLSFGLVMLMLSMYKYYG